MQNFKMFKNNSNVYLTKFKKNTNKNNRKYYTFDDLILSLNFEDDVNILSNLSSFINNNFHSYNTFYFSNFTEFLNCLNYKSITVFFISIDKLFKNTIEFYSLNGEDKSTYELCYLNYNCINNFCLSIILYLKNYYLTILINNNCLSSIISIVVNILKLTCLNKTIKNKLYKSFIKSMMHLDLNENSKLNNNRLKNKDKIVNISDFTNSIKFFLAENNKSIYCLIFLSELISYNFDINNCSNKYKIYFKPELIKDFVFNYLNPFYDNEIMIDQDVDKKLAYQKLFFPCLRIFDDNQIAAYSFDNNKEEVFSFTINYLVRLMNRNSTNYKFIENFLTYKRINYFIPSIQINSLFSKFKNYFFQKKSKAITFSAIKSFNFFTKNKIRTKDYNDLIDYLLNTNFSADEVDINFNLSLYLISFISNKKLDISCFFKSLYFIFNNIYNNYKDSLKPGFEEMLNLLIKGIKKNDIDFSNESLNNESNKQAIEEYIKTYSLLFSDSKFSLFYQKFCLILNIIIVKFKSNISCDILNLNTYIQSLCNHLERLIEFASPENTNSIFTLALASNFNNEIGKDNETFHSNLDSFIDLIYFEEIDKECPIGNYAKSLIEADKMCEDSNYIYLNNLTDDQALCLCIIILNSVNYQYISYLQNENVMNRLLVKILLSNSFNLTNKLALSFIKKTLSSFFINNKEENYKFIDTLLSNILKFIVNDYNKTPCYKYIGINASCIKFIISELVGNKDFIDLVNKENNFNTKNKYIFLIHLINSSKMINSNSSKDFKPLFNKKLNNLASQIFIGKESNKQSYIETLKDTEYITKTINYVLNNNGLFNNLNKVVRYVSLSLLSQITYYNKDINFKSELTNLLLDTIDLCKIDHIYNSLTMLEKEINYLSYYDLKLCLEEIKLKVNNQNVEHAIVIEDEDDYLKKNKIDKNSVRSILGSEYKKQILNIMYNNLNYYRYKLKQIDLLVEKKLFMLTNNNKLNEKIFNVFSSLAKYKNLEEISCNIIVNLLSTDIEVNYLGNNFKQFLISGYKLIISKNLNYADNSTSTQTTTLKSNINNFLNQCKEVYSIIKNNLGLKDNNLNIDNSEVADCNIYREKFNNFINKFSNLIIDSVMISLNNNIIETDFKESGVDLLDLLLTFKINEYTLNKVSLFLISFLKTKYYSINQENLIKTFFIKCNDTDNNTYLIKYFISVLYDILDYNYIAKNKIIDVCLSNPNIHNIINKDINISCKIAILLFDSNENLVSDCISLWNNAHFSINKEFVNSNEFNIINYYSKDKVIAEMCAKFISLYLHFNLTTNEFNNVNIAIQRIISILQQIDNECIVNENIKIDKKAKEITENYIKDNRLTGIDDDDYEVEEVDLLIDESIEVRSYKNNLDNYKSIKIIYINILVQNISLYSNDNITEITKFIVNNAIYENDKDVDKSYNNLIRILMFSIDNVSVLIKILNFCEENLYKCENYDSKATNKTDSSEEKFICNPLIVLNTINTILNKLIKLKTIEKLTIFSYLKKLMFSTSEKEILILASYGISNLLAINNDYEKEVLNSIDKTIADLFVINSASIISIEKGYFYILSAYLRFKGIGYFYKLNLNVLIEENYHSTLKNNSNNAISQKVHILNLLVILSSSLKKLFEPIFVSLFDYICNMISNREEEVRNAAMETVKSQIRYISGYGVKKILPLLIKDLHSMNWKSKIVNVEILGHFSYCAPKQLSSFLPTVIKELIIVFKDPHPKVMATSIKVLKDISSVIKNPEIVDLSDILINAFSNPFEYSKSALTALLNTKFRHAIDAPSLGLIIPIIDYNLKINNNDNKMMSAHLIGSISYLISSPDIIYPYLDIIFPNLKTALFDSSPEVRNAVSKAIGSLTKSLGDLHKNEIIDWISYYLEHEVDLVQRSGASQAYAEILIAFGEDNLTNSLPNIIDKIQTDNKICKEGYLGIFVFLPGCLGEKFEKYFDYVFPLIIDGFSDESEKVRNVSNKIFEICITLFTKKNPKDLVSPLINSLFNPNWRIRNSSIALIKTLIGYLNKDFFYCKNIDDNDEEDTESNKFTSDLRDAILCNTFILKADTFGNTATIANMIWRDYVDNIPRYLSTILDQVYIRIMELLSSKNDDTLDIAEGIISIFVTKFSDKFFMEMLPLIKNSIESPSINEIEAYSSFTILQIACIKGGERLLSGFKDVIIKIVNNNVLSNYFVIRKILANIIYELSSKQNDQTVGKQFIHNTFKKGRLLIEEELKTSDLFNEDSSVLDQYKISKHVNEELEKILDVICSFVETSKGELLQNVLHEVFKKPYVGKYFDIIYMISDPMADYLTDPIRLEEVFNNLINALKHVPKEAGKALISITLQLDEEFVKRFIDYLKKIKNSVQNPYSEYNIIISNIETLCQYLDETDQNLNLIVNDIMYYLCEFLIYDQYNEENIATRSNNLLEKQHYNKVLTLLNKGFKTFIEKLNSTTNEYSDVSKSITDVSNILYNNFTSIINQYLIEDESVDVKTKDVRISSKIHLLFESLMIIIDNYLIHCSDKLMACKLIEFVVNSLQKPSLKLYLIKISGKIIKILSEKVTYESKEIILNTVCSLVTKLECDFKPMIPHFRTILLKNLIDSNLIILNNSSQSIIKLQFKVCDCLLKILTYDSRVDLIINDINKHINNKLNNKNLSLISIEFEIIAYIIYFHGKSLKHNVLIELVNFYLDIFNSNKENKELQVDIFILLLSILYNNLNNLLNENITSNCEELKSTISKLNSAFETNENNLIIYKFLCKFTLNEKDFSSKNLIKYVKIIDKNILILPLKLIGKLINKTKFFYARDNEDNKLLINYNEFISDLVNQTDVFIPTDNIIDANLLVFLISVGWCPCYNDKKSNNAFNIILDYILTLTREGTINSQLLINSLSLIVLKKLIEKPDYDMILAELYVLDVDEDRIEDVKIFFKKAHYLLK